MKRKILKFIEKDYSKSLFFILMALISLLFLLFELYKNDVVSCYFIATNHVVYFLLFLITVPKERIVKKEVIE